MAKQLFINTASALLAVNVSAADTTVQVQSGFGALYPSPTGGDFFTLTLEDNNGNIEITHCTGRSGDLMTVVRAREGTLAQAFTNTVTRVEVRLTAAAMERMLQRSGDTLAGDLGLGGFTLQGPGALGAGVAIPKASVFPVGMIVLWSGSIASIPAGWHICNGADGTPDLRNRFVIGAGDSYPVAGSGGAASASLATDTQGAHTPTSQPATITLTKDNMPSHTHRIYAQLSGGAGDTESFANTNAAIAGNADGTKGYTYNDGGGHQLIENFGGGGASSNITHNHTLDAVAGHAHNVTVPTVPPYYALCYIMFMG